MQKKKNSNVEKTKYLPSEEDVAFYEKNGYWLSPVFLSERELDHLRKHHAAVIAGQYETKREPWFRSIPAEGPIDSMLKVDNSYWTDASISRLVTSPVLGAMAARLSHSSTIRLWHDQLLLKPPHSGEAGNVGWHQDRNYWQCADPPELLTAWVALDDITQEIGCMEVVPGSHKWGLLPGGDFFSSDMESLAANIEALSGKKFRTVKCEIPAGSCSFHHCLTIHGSRPNTTDRPRRSIVVHLQPGTTYFHAGTDGDGHMNVGLLSGSDGDAFEGPYFPVLYDES